MRDPKHHYISKHKNHSFSVRLAFHRCTAHLHFARILFLVQIDSLVPVALKAAIVARHVRAESLVATVVALWRDCYLRFDGLWQCKPAARFGQHAMELFRRNSVVGNVEEANVAAGIVESSAYATLCSSILRRSQDKSCELKMTIHVL